MKKFKTTRTTLQLNKHEGAQPQQGGSFVPIRFELMMPMMEKLHEKPHMQHQQIARNVMMRITKMSQSQQPS